MAIYVYGDQKQAIRKSMDPDSTNENFVFSDMKGDIEPKGYNRQTDKLVIGSSVENLLLKIAVQEHKADSKENANKLHELRMATHVKDRFKNKALIVVNDDPKNIKATDKLEIEAFAERLKLPLIYKAQITEEITQKLQDENSTMLDIMKIVAKDKHEKTSLEVEEFCKAASAKDDPKTLIKLSKQPGFAENYGEFMPLIDHMQSMLKQKSTTSMHAKPVPDKAKAIAQLFKDYVNANKQNSTNGIWKLREALENSDLNKARSKFPGVGKPKTIQLITQLIERLQKEPILGVTNKRG